MPFSLPHTEMSVNRGLTALLWFGLSCLLCPICPSRFVMVSSQRVLLSSRRYTRLILCHLGWSRSSFSRRTSCPPLVVRYDRDLIGSLHWRLPWFGIASSMYR